MSEAMTTIELPSHPSSEDISDLLEQLIQTANTPVTISAERVATLTAPQLQVLIAAKKRWSSDDASFHVDSPSEGFTRCLRLFGLSPDFFDEKAIT